MTHALVQETALQQPPHALQRRQGLYSDYWRNQAPQPVHKHAAKRLSFGTATAHSESALLLVTFRFVKQRVERHPAPSQYVRPCTFVFKHHWILDEVGRCDRKVDA